MVPRTIFLCYNIPMKAVIFDLDDTLYNQLQPFERAVGQFMDLEEGELEALYLAFRYRADEVFEDSVKGVLSMRDMHTYRMKAAFADRGVRISNEEAYAIQEAYAYQQGHLDLTAGSQEVFSFCQEKGLALGLITNGPHLHQLKKIQALGLHDWIPEELTIISGQVGMTKPAEGIFRLMEKRLKLAPEDICYVGDSFENDVVGAKAAGWKAVWYNHRGRKVDNSFVSPDDTVKDFQALQDWLKDQI